MILKIYKFAKNTKNVLKRKQKYIILMTTFFISGCEPNQDMAMDYFDTLHTSVENTLDFDEQIQEKIFFFTLDDDFSDIPGNKGDKPKNKSTNKQTLSKEEYMNELAVFKVFGKSVSDQLSSEIDKLKSTEVFNNENALKNTALHLVQTMKDCVQNELTKILILLEMDYEKYTDEEDEKLNILLTNFNNKMDNALQIYYSELEVYSDKYNLDLEFPE